MTLRPSSFALAVALLPLAAHAAPYTYHGDLLDGALPADGHYDLRVRAYGQPGAKTALAEATELPGVRVTQGRFSVELDLPEDADGTTWIEVALREAGSGDDYETLGDPQPVAKVNTTCPGAWALDGNSGAPVGSYIGFADDREVFVTSPAGVAVNSTTADLAGPVDLSIHAKSGGDSDADLQLVTRNGRVGQTYVRDVGGNVVNFSSAGGFEYFDGIPTSTQNNGIAPYTFSGRLRSGAAGDDATDTSGGLWLDDERANASFVGRGDNQSNWTGIYEAAGGWRFTSHDNGAFGFNTGTEALPANQTKFLATGGMRINTRNFPVFFQDSLAIGPISPTTGATSMVIQSNVPGQTDPVDARLTMQADAGGDRPFFAIDVEGNGEMHLGDAVGILRGVTSNALEVEGTASKTTAGDWASNSDRRIKTDIAAIPDALDTILRLRPITFRYEAAYREEHESIDAGRYYNVIAQEFAEVFPAAVKGSGEYLPGKAKSPENEILQVDTYPAQITAIAAIQELAVQDDALRDELARTRAENAQLRARLDALAARLDIVAARAER